MLGAMLFREDAVGRGGTRDPRNEHIGGAHALSDRVFTSAVPTIANPRREPAISRAKIRTAASGAFPRMLQKMFVCDAGVERSRGASTRHSTASFLPTRAAPRRVLSARCEQHRSRRERFHRVNGEADRSRAPEYQLHRPPSVIRGHGIDRDGKMRIPLATAFPRFPTLIDAI